MQINFSADIQASDQESRTLAGQIVPFNKVGNTSAGKVMFLEGSFVELDPKNVKLLFEHENTKPLGRAIELSVTDAGVDGKFKVAKTTRGNDVLVEAEENLRTGFSVGCSILDYEYENGVMKVSAAQLLEVSVVASPAFGQDSQITDIAATSNEVEPTPNNENEEKVEEQTPQVEDVVEASEVVVASAQPIYTKPRVKPLTDGEVLAHAVYAAAGNEDSRRLLVEAADDTSNNTGFTLSKGLPTFLSNSFVDAPAISAIGSSALPATGMTYTIPRLTQSPDVNVEGELDTIVNVDTESDYLSVDVIKLAGAQSVSWELLDRSEPSFGEIMIRELQRAYTKQADQTVLAELLNGTAGTNQTGDWVGLQQFVATEVPAAYMATGGLIANKLIGSSAWWTELIGAVDNSDRPVFNAVSPSNAGGSVGVGAPRGNVFGLDFSVDHNISTVGLIDDSAFLVAPEAVGIWQSPQVQLRTNVLSNGSVDVALYGYMAVKVLKSGGVRRFAIA